MAKRLAFFFFVLINFLSASWYLLKGDILFHVDIARDFLVLEEIVFLKKLTLIGARSGGIPGLFHGPLWFYLNLPAFLIGKGNPLFVGLFWIILFALSLIIIYNIAKKVFDKSTAQLSTILFASTISGSVFGLFNPFGAEMLFPVMFYFYYLYVTKNKLIFAILTLFLAGIVAHFQMAFGMPIIFLTTAHLCYLFIKNRKPRHFISLASLPISMSSFIIFDLRHDFLQIKSLLQYVSGASGMGNLKPFSLIISRLKGFFIGGLQLTVEEFIPLSILISAFLFYYFYNIFKNKKYPKRAFFLIFFYLYTGFWVSVLLFKGPVWNYYLIPFMPILMIIFASLYQKTNKKIYITIFALIIIFNTIKNVQHVLNADKFIGIDGSSWKFNLTMASNLYKQADNEFGYFIFSPEMFGYTPRYAMNYAQKIYSDKKAYPFEKKKNTYLILLPIPSNRPDLSHDWWIKNRVYLKGTPVAELKYKNGYIIQKYSLSDKDIAVPADPNLPKDLHFR